jgi:hypothetical protein
MGVFVECVENADVAHCRARDSFLLITHNGLDTTARVLGDASKCCSLYRQ